MLEPLLEPPNILATVSESKCTIAVHLILLKLADVDTTCHLFFLLLLRLTILFIGGTCSLYL